MDVPKRLDLGYSLKNIPFPSPDTYTARLIEKVEDLIKRMRWRAFFFLRNDTADDETEHREHFGFRTRKCPPKIQELEAFENDLLEMIEISSSGKLPTRYSSNSRKTPRRSERWKRSSCRPTRPGTYMRLRRRATINFCGITLQRATSKPPHRRIPTLTTRQKT